MSSLPYINLFTISLTEIYQDLILMSLARTILECALNQA